MNDPTFASLFTGVGGIDLGLERAGWQVAFQCESDPWRRRILERHWPGVPCHEDVRAIRVESAPRGARDVHGSCGDQAGGVYAGAVPVDLVAGGFPCQDLSVAGRRAGFQGNRSSLFFEFARLADDLVRPGGWVLIENVPGLLSSHRGRDFAILLATLAELGFHDLAWRVLDSRHFGVPQRRRRVFIVARRAHGRSAFEVLLEPESGGGNSQASKQTRTRVAGVLGSGSSSVRLNHDGDYVVNALDRRRGGADDNEAQAGHLVANTLKAHRGKGGGGLGPEETMLPIAGQSVRRLSPVECERLQSFPDGWTLPTGPSLARQPSHPHRIDESCPPPDGPRYAAMGDAVTVNVIEWIGRRLIDLGPEQHKERNP